MVKTQATTPAARRFTKRRGGRFEVGPQRRGADDSIYASSRVESRSPFNESVHFHPFSRHKYLAPFLPHNRRSGLPTPVQWHTYGDKLDFLLKIILNA